MSLIKFIYIVMVSAVLSGCLPKDVANPEGVGNSKSYDGFTGITSAETLSDTRVLVKWTPSTDSKVVAYNIYDSTFRFNPKLIRTVTAPASQVTLNGLATQSLYSFRVRAADEKNEEDTNAADLQAIPYAGVLSSQVISSTEARIHFTQGVDVDEVGVFCRAGDTATYERVGTVRNLAITHVNVPNLIPGTLYTCRAAVDIDGFSDNNPATTQFTPLGQASEIIFSTQPSNSPAGQALSVQPVVTIRDVNGNVVAGGPDSTALITLSVANTSPTTGIVNGATSVAAVAGVAVFTGLNLNEAGIKILSATKADTSAVSFGTGVMTANSNNFTITAGPASPDMSELTLSPVVPPADPVIANGTDTYTVTMRLRDQFGNPISAVRPQFASNVTGDTLTQPSANTNAFGITTGTISATTADAPPTTVRRLRISAPAGLTAVETPAPFRHGTPTKLAFTTQPLNSPAGVMGMSPMQVAVQDAQGNTITSGANSTAEITLSIASNVNGAVLSGTNPKFAVAGTTGFTDMGIDRTGTGYRLVASSGSLTPAFSNTFNVTAGVPKKIAITGPANTLSGACSTAVTIQLQDLGSNPTNAIQNTPVVISGLGSTSMFSASNCSGAALSTTMIFTAGTNTRTVYLRNNAAQAASIVGTDSSGVMTPATFAATFSPKKIGLLAQAASPAPPLTPLKVAAGACSTEILITPMGQNGIPGPTFMPTTVAITGLSSSPAQLFRDAACTQQITPSSITLPINSGPDFPMKIYLRDNLAESLTLSVTDPSGILETTTGPQSVTVTPANIHWTGPTSVVAGLCSAAFTINLRDGLANNATALVDTPLTINGVPQASTGRFFTSASCTGGGTYDTLTFPQSATSLLVYFKGTGSGSYNLSISDPGGILTTSQTINLAVSPSALRVVAPGAGSSNTNVCAGPFQVQTLDSLNQLSNAVTTITANITGGGTAGSFYSDAACDLPTTQVQFTAGQNQRSIYFRGYFPETLLNFTATDVASVLTPASANWAVVAKPAWIGTAAETTDAGGNDLWFRANAKPVAARYDGIFSATRMNFDPTRQFLYVVDQDMHRVLKYDYTNGTYVGWLGGFRLVGGIGITGSNLTIPSDAQCAATLNNTATPGWCIGGQPEAAVNNTTGRLFSPNFVIDDGSFIYVSNRSGQSVNRFESQSGAPAGFIGWITNNSGMLPAAGGPAECSTAGSNIQTPGWCRSGANGDHGQRNAVTGDGRIAEPRGLALDNDYLYVLGQSSITRYEKATGAFAGWIGRVGTTPTGGAPGCNGLIAGDQTTGWCIGGAAAAVNTLTAPIGGIDNSNTGVYSIGTELIVTRSNGAVMRYDRDTGAVLGPLSSLALNWVSTNQMTTDGTHLYFADHQRVIKTDMNGLVESWLGKVANNASMSGSPGCSTLSVNDDTPGWCLGGTSRPGFDYTSFRQLTAIAYDGNGKFLVGEAGGSGTIRRFNLATGMYEGTLSLESVGPNNWSNNATMPTERNGFDDSTLFNPLGLHVAGDSLFVADSSASRVKKINRKTGELEGWIGAVTSRPTGGLSPSCLTANSFSASPGWCLGAKFLPNALFYDASMINTQANGVMHTPNGMTSDATYLYVTDWELHRIVRYRISTGLSEGWIGNIAISPTGGDPGCNGATVGTFTPGWCTGGRSGAGSGDGMLNRPAEIVVTGGNIYVTDRANHRISSYTALTGAFNGWIGRTLTTPTSGCTRANNGNYEVSTSGWCRGGTSQAGTSADRGGGFNFWGSFPVGLTTNGTNLYIANFNNNRIDRYNLNGQFLGSTRSRDDVYTNSWTTDANVIATMGAPTCSYPMSLWTDGTFLYGTNHQPCTRNGDAFNVFKMNLSTGQMVGWQGGIFGSNLPFDGDAGCAGATERTPGWCRGGTTTAGLRMGQFSGTMGYVTGDTNFIYVSDQTGNRVTRLPK